MKAKRAKLDKLKESIGALEAFHEEISSQWSDIARRNIGHVDWAPEISVNVQGRGYTKDIGTFEVDAAKFKAEFKGNVVDLGGFCLIFLIYTSSNKNNLQGPSLLPVNSARCSTLKMAVGRGSGASLFASSGSTVFSRASSWLNPTVSTTTRSPALSSRRTVTPPTSRLDATPAWRLTFAITLGSSLSNSPSIITICGPARSPPRVIQARSSSIAWVVWLVLFTLGCRKARATTSPTPPPPGGPSSNSNSSTRTPTLTAPLSKREHHRRPSALPSPRSFSL